MTSLAFARKPPASPAQATANPAPAGRWLAILLVGLLLAVFGLAARGGR
jgi:hypothetical protein